MGNLGRVFTGRVISSKMKKTAVVAVDRVKMHPLYGKRIRSKVRLYAHDPKNLCNDGDLVRIIEARPYSKLKRFRFLGFAERPSNSLSVSKESIKVSDYSDSSVIESTNAPTFNTQDTDPSQQTDEIIDEQIGRNDQ
jgi:small subunit ribosomal protein S17